MIYDKILKCILVITYFYRINPSSTIKIKTNYVHCSWDYPDTFNICSACCSPIGTGWAKHV